MSRYLLVVLVLALSLFVLAGCEEPVNDVDVVEDPDEPAEPLKIGFSGALTGPYSEFGEGLRRAYEVAIEEWNEKGGVNGREIVLITRDDQLDPSEALSNVRELIEVEEVDLLMGPPGSGPTMATLPIVQANDYVFFHYAATNEAIYPEGMDNPPYPYVFGFNVLNDITAQAMASYVAENFENIGILVESTTYGTNTRDWLIEALEEYHGISPVGTEVYDQGDADMTAQLSRLQRDGAEVLVVEGLGADMAVIRQGMERLNFDAHLHGGGGIMSMPYVEIARELAIGTTASGPATYVGEPERAQAKEFAEKYYAMWGNDDWYGDGEWPTPFFTYNAYGYDSINYLLEAVNEAGTTDADAVVEAIYNIEYSGVHMDYSFSPDRHHAHTVEFVGVTLYEFDEEVGIRIVRIQ